MYIQYHGTGQCTHVDACSDIHCTCEPATLSIVPKHSVSVRFHHARATFTWLLLADDFTSYSVTLVI